MILVSLHIMQHQGTKEINFQCQGTEWITDSCDIYKEKEAGSHNICLWKIACTGPTARPKKLWWCRKQKKENQTAWQVDQVKMNGVVKQCHIQHPLCSDSREPFSGFLCSLSIANNPLGAEGKGDPSISKSSFFCGESYITSFMSFRKLVWICIQL